MLRFALDPLGTSTRLFHHYGDLAAIVRGPARIMTPTGRAVLVARGAEINRAVVTEHDVLHSYALPGVFFPEEEELARLEKRGPLASLFGRPLKIVLAILLQRFRFELAPDARIDRRVAITMAPKHGMPMILRRADSTWRREGTPRRSFF